MRHADHVIPRARGGRTTLDGGQGLCEACNYAKESPGWHQVPLAGWPRRHTVETTTPTDHTHRSHAPPLPVRPSPPSPLRPLSPPGIEAEIHYFHPSPQIRLAG